MKSLLCLCVLGLLLVCLPLSLLSAQSTVENLDSVIYSLESLSNDLQSLQTTIDALKNQKEQLIQQLQASQSDSTQLQQQLATLDEQLTSYQAKVETLKKNYAGLLRLSRKLESELQISNTWATVLGISAAVLGVGLTISLAVPR